MLKIIDIENSIGENIIEPTINNIKITKFLEDLSDDSFTNNSYLKNDEYIINKNIRNSFVNNSLFNVDFLNIIPTLSENGLETSNCIEDWQLLMYTLDCKFSKHSDSELDYTILLFPPNNINKFKGGELIIYKDNEKIVIDPSKFEKYKLIIFSKELEHEVLNVLEGTRYVFKKSFSNKIPRIKQIGIPPYTIPNSSDTILDGGCKHIKKNNGYSCIIA